MFHMLHLSGDFLSRRGPHLPTYPMEPTGSQQPPARRTSQDLDKVGAQPSDARLDQKFLVQIPKNFGEKDHKK